MFFRTTWASCTPQSYPCSACPVEFGNTTSEFKSQQGPRLYNWATARVGLLPRRGGRFCNNPVGWDGENIRIKGCWSERSSKNSSKTKLCLCSSGTGWLPGKLPNDKAFPRIGLCGLPGKKLVLGVLSTLLKPLFLGIVPQLSSKLGLWHERQMLKLCPNKVQRFRCSALKCLQKMLTPEAHDKSKAPFES